MAESRGDSSVGNVSYSIFGSGVPENGDTEHRYDAPGTVMDGFSPFVELETREPAMSNAYHNILFMECYKNWSAEELRIADYDKDRRFGGSTGTTAIKAGFGVTSLFAPFGSTATSPDFTPGIKTPATSIFGTASRDQASGFSSSTTSMIGRFGSTPDTGPLDTAKRPGTSSQDLSASDRSIDETEEEWLRNRYSGTSSISIKCGSDDKDYLFPKEVLMRHFRYFRTTLEKEDGSHNQNPPERVFNVHLEDHTTMAFARVVRWTQTDPRSREDPANPTGDHTVSELLDQIIAAHHLGLDDLKEFEAHTSCLLATILLQDRRKLSSAHIDIVDSHECFEKNSPVMRVLFKARCETIPAVDYA